jgi:hypothetical protein
MNKASVRQAILVIAAVFFGGFVAGVALEDQVEKLPLPFVTNERDYDDDLEDVIDGERQLVGRLGLNADQRQRVDAALTKRENALVDYWAVRIPEMQQIIEASRTELRGMFSAEQRARYDEGLAEMLRSVEADRD